MLHFLRELFSSGGYIPHGHCYLWQTPLVALHALSDILITLSYYSIPIMLIYFVKKRKDIPFREVFVLFGAFILSCGTTHILEVWTLWYPAYWVSGGVKAFTALVSVYTAFDLFPLIPQALSLPSPTQLESLNQQLSQEISERKAAEEKIRQLNAELERRVKERTEALELEVKERQQTEKALRESQLLNERITQLTPNLLYIYDLEKHCNVYCNDFITDMLGYTSDDVKDMGNTMLEKLIHPEDLGEYYHNLKRFNTLKKDDYLELEYRIKNTNGEWRWLHSRETIFARSQEGIVKQIFGIAADITERKETNLELQTINQQMSERVKELELRTQQMIRLGEMSDILQACLSVSEAENTLADLLKPLFPGCSGGVYVIKPSRDFLEMVASWGNLVGSNLMFAPNDCWGLRKGSTHVSHADQSSLYCHHIHGVTEAKTSLCVPMMAQGETLGLLYLRFDDPHRFTPTKRQLAETVSKQIAIAIANLRLRETLQNQSFRDALTGLYNRRYLEASMTRELHRAKRNNQPLAVVMIDVDHFKQFNDTYGHDAGDLVLQNISLHLQKNTRQSDIPCRFGGEELTILMLDSDMKDAIRRAEELRQGIKLLRLQYQGNTLTGITVSIGISAFPEHGEDPEELFKLADEALYKAKRSGRDRVIYADLTETDSCEFTYQI